MNATKKYLILLNLVIMLIISSFSIAANVTQQVVISKITFNHNKKITMDSRLVLTLNGKNLQQLSRAKIAHNNSVIGTAELEKYSSKGNTERRLVVKINQYSSHPLSLEIFAKNKKVPLPKNFKL